MASSQRRGWARRLHLIDIYRSILVSLDQWLFKFALARGLNKNIAPLNGDKVVFWPIKNNWKCLPRSLLTLSLEPKKNRQVAKIGEVAYELSENWRLEHLQILEFSVFRKSRFWHSTALIKGSIFSGQGANINKGRRLWKTSFSSQTTFRQQRQRFGYL